MLRVVVAFGHSKVTSPKKVRDASLLLLERCAAMSRSSL